MSILLMWLLVTSIILSGVAILLTITLRQLRAHDIEAGPLPEKNSEYKDKDSVSASIGSEQEEDDTRLPERVTRSDTERATWVLRMTHHVFTERHKGRYNVVVINNHLEYHFKPKSEVERFLVEYKNSKRPWVVPYLVVVFCQGTLLNLGDGGDINWDWQGNFTRNGDKLLSFKPCVLGVAYKQDPWTAV